MDDTLRTDVIILGRRSRKTWTCSAASECSVGVPIDLDEVYVEHAEGVHQFDGNTNRYHIACALNRQIVKLVEKAVDLGNGRRQAIAEQRARRAAANAN